jgi:hypothetical protein
MTPAGRSLACAREAHQECGHVSAGTRFVSRRRLKSTVVLCRCSCHAACPLADRMPVPLTVWQQLCGCPGAESKRAWREDPDEPWPGATEYREREQRESRERNDAHTRAFHAARDAAPGKTRDEVRDLYMAELRARGLEVPPEPVLGATIDLLIGHPLRGLWKIWKERPRPFSDL